MLKILLNSGNEIPIFGLGTADPMHDVPPPKWIKGRILNALYRRTFYRLHWLYRAFKLSFAIKHAIDSGYKMIDTSSAYHNAFFIRVGILLSTAKREDLFLITRISNYEQWNSSVRKSVTKSLKQLNTSYIDLFMFHWPVPEVFEKTWKEMEEVYKEGLVKSIGVANCHQHHLEKILRIANITPSVNEFEIHPLMSQTELVNYCKTKNILPMAYTPIGRMHEKIINNDALVQLAIKYSKSVPQIVLRWHIQRGIPVIPRSISTDNLTKNIDVFDFELNSPEMDTINSINENLRLRYDPDNVDFTKC